MKNKGKERYDLFIPCGRQCASAFHLKINGLRLASFPFDWVWGLSLEKCYYFLNNRFDDYLIKDQLILMDSNDKEHAAYKTPKEIGFNHDFLKGLSLDDCYDDVKSKYDRRINRLYQKISNAKRICFFHYEFDDVKRKESEEEIRSTWSKYNKLFAKKEIFLIYIREKNTKEIITQNLADNAVLYDVPSVIHTDVHWSGNIEAVAKILSEFDLSYPVIIRHKLNKYKNKVIKIFFKIYKIFVGKEKTEEIKIKWNLHQNLLD